jgi:hypothetical protein
MKIILTLLLTISQAFAIDVQPIKKGSPAPNDGFFVDSENMKKLRNINEEKKLLEKENIDLRELSIVHETRIENYRQLNKDVEKELRWEKTKSNFSGVGGFIIGVLATSLAAYAAMQATK